MEYKVCICASGNIDKLKVLELLENHSINKKDIYIFVKDNAQAKQIEAYKNKLTEYNIVTTKEEPTSQRDCISNYFSTNEFIISIDEEVEEIYEHNKKLIDLKTLINDTFHFLLANDLTLCGVYPINNYLWTKKTISCTLKYCSDNLKFFINKKQLEKRYYDLLGDYENTIRHYIFSGGVMRYNYITVKMDSREARKSTRPLQDKIKEVKTFHSDFKGYCLIEKNYQDIILLENPIRDVVQSLWIGETFNEVTSLCIESWLKHDYQVDLYIDKVFKLPKKFKKYKDNNQLQFYYASEIIPYTKGTEILPFSDLFRYKLLYEKGGTWLDTDMFMLRRLPKDKIIISSEHTILEGAFKSKLRYKANIGVLRFDKGNMLLDTVIKKIELSKKVHTGFERMLIFTKLVMRSNLLDVSMPELYCPVAWWNAKELYYEEQLKLKYGVEPWQHHQILSKSTCVHLWNHHTYNKHRINFSKIHEASLFAKLYKLIND